MPRVRRTPASRTDYKDIHDYIAFESPQNAAAVLRRIDSRLEMLARNNLVGRPRPEIAHTSAVFPKEPTSFSIVRLKMVLISSVCFTRREIFLWLILSKAGSRHCLCDARRKRLAFPLILWHVTRP